jgi:hypothetical protein
MTRRLACWKSDQSSVLYEAKIETLILVSFIQLARYFYQSTDMTRNSLIVVVPLLLVNLKLLSIYCKA